MRKFLLVILTLILFSALSLGQGLQPPKYHPFSGTLVLTFEGGATLESTDYGGLGLDYFGKANLEYFLKAFSKSSFGFRLTGGGGFISGTDDALAETEFRTGVAFFGGGIVYLITANDKTFPYLSVGISNVWFDPKGSNGEPLPNNSSGKYSKSEINFNGELGVRYLLTDNLTVNFDLGVNISPNDNLDDLTSGTSNDMYFTSAVGLSFSFFAETDADGDGVVDSKDMCPNTGFGIKVDEFGCPQDSDQDGVPDYKDKCDETPKGAKVDADGCPIDSDQDGVPDFSDLCPNTPRNIEVDDYGCPFDLDADGVPDYLDKCPDTPYGTDVDAKGCPLDSDLDGVPDNLDQCPDSAPGEIVDEKGCTKVIKLEEPQPIKEFVLSASTSFEFNSAVLKPAAIAELEKLLEEMKRDPISRWRIEGHTDNIGSKEGNMKMSQMRAESVMNFFLSRGITKNRLEAIGFGDTLPVADNKTEEARAKNRRVVITRVN